MTPRIIYRGTAIVYARCEHCGKLFQCPRETPFNFCPWCCVRLKWQDM